MNILVKLPSRSRPEKCFDIIESYSQMADNPVQIMVNYDIDDPTMNNPGVVRRLTSYDNVIACEGTSISKIHAINRDFQKMPEFDILVLASDDMICQVKGWDTILKQEMATHFPDTDGTLFHWDGDPATRRHNNGKGLCTMCILGKKYFDRFGFIYHPDYTSLWCDNEFTDVAQQLGKMFFSEDVLFKHVHYSNDGSKPDALMMKTQSFYRQDEQVYNRRKSFNFGL